MEENVIQINDGIMINFNVNVKDMFGMFWNPKKKMIEKKNEKDYVWNPTTCKLLSMIQRLCVMKL